MFVIVTVGALPQQGQELSLFTFLGEVEALAEMLGKVINVMEEC